jgi:DNA-binding response OmpR family regulator
MPRILMIEDDQRLSAMVREYLEPFGIRVTAKANAAAGLKVLKQESFDALILDVMLPDQDGFEVCRKVRTESELPILMLTARGDELDRIVGLELGAEPTRPNPGGPGAPFQRRKAGVVRQSGPGYRRAG